MSLVTLAASIYPSRSSKELHHRQRDGVDPRAAQKLPGGHGASRARHQGEHEIERSSTTWSRRTADGFGGQQNHSRRPRLRRLEDTTARPGACRSSIAQGAEIGSSKGELQLLPLRHSSTCNCPPSRQTPDDPARQMWAMATFGRFFFGQLVAVYLPRSSIASVDLLDLMQARPWLKLLNRQSSKDSSARRGFPLELRRVSNPGRLPSCFSTGPARNTRRSEFHGVAHSPSSSGKKAMSPGSSTGEGVDE